MLLHKVRMKVINYNILTDSPFNVFLFVQDSL